MQKLLEVAQFKAIRGNLILVIIASYTLILELVNRSPLWMVEVIDVSGKQNRGARNFVRQALLDKKHQL